MNWCVGLSGAAMRSLLLALEGMAQAGVEAGLSPAEARRVAARVMLSTAALQTDLSFGQLKAITPMRTVDEEEVARTFRAAVQEAKDRAEMNWSARSPERLLKVFAAERCLPQMTGRSFRSREVGLGRGRRVRVLRPTARTRWQTMTVNPWWSRDSFGTTPYEEGRFLAPWQS